MSQYHFLLGMAVGLPVVAATALLARRRARSEPARVATKLYGSIVAQARAPDFYVGVGVPDTIGGRFELVVLHLFLVLERLRGEGQAGQAIGQALLERFVADMDDQMREIGISDLAVPRRIAKTAAAIKERVEDYRAALANGNGEDSALRAALKGHVGHSLDAHRLARYVRVCGEAMASQPREALLSGRLDLRVPVGAIEGRR